MTMSDAQHHLRQQLEGLYDLRESSNIADLVMEKLTGLTRGGRLMHKHTPLSEEQENRLQEYGTALLLGKPVQYVLDESWFAGMPFHVNTDVLIPRPETEELAEWGIELMNKSSQPCARILDMGTGSGILAITLKKRLPRAAVTAIDKSEGALAVARRNAYALGAQIEFQQLDFLNPEHRKTLGTFDLIISNPPYIPLRDKPSMAPNVLDHEPHLALFVDNDDPLVFYQALAEFGQTHLIPGGMLLCEIHEELGAATATLLRDKGYHGVELKKDLQGKDRMVCGML